MNSLAAILGVGVLLSVFSAAAAADGSTDTNAANNPLTPKVTINLQDYYTPSIFGLPNKQSNSFLLRGLIPANIGGIPQLFRFTLPLSTVPTLPNGAATGLGDVTLMDILVVPGKISFGGGPLIVVPTATSTETGQGRWQAGTVGVVVAPQRWGLLAGLATYQHSFAATFGRETQSLLTVQPIAFYNLPEQYYLRSSAVWNFDLQNRVGYIPVGLGVGKVWELNKSMTMNAFIEPQYTVYHYGNGVPHWQIFGGVNFQFAIGNGAANLPKNGGKS